MEKEKKGIVFTAIIVALLISGFIFLCAMLPTIKNPKQYNVINIDGCEYIRYFNSEFITHKENCGNYEHKRK